MRRHSFDCRCDNVNWKRLHWSRMLSSVWKKHTAKRLHVWWRIGLIWRRNIRTCDWPIQRLPKDSNNEWPLVSRYVFHVIYIFIYLLCMRFAHRMLNLNGEQNDYEFYIIDFCTGTWRGRQCWETSIGCHASTTCARTYQSTKTRGHDMLHPSAHRTNNQCMIYIFTFAS